MNDLIYHPSMATYACVRVLSLWSSLVMVSKGNRSGRLAICSSRTGERSTRSPSFLREVINPCGRGTRVSRVTFVSSHLVECSIGLGWCGVLLALPVAVVPSPSRPYRAGQGASVLVMVGLGFGG
jgi:hypothetical protein